MEEKKKRNNATVTFSSKAEKEQLQNLMPDGVKRKDCKKVLWAVDYLYKLALKGRIRIEVPMFETDSQEKQLLIEENEQLKAKLKELGTLGEPNKLLRLAARQSNFNFKSYKSAFLRT